MYTRSPPTPLPPPPPANARAPASHTNNTVQILTSLQILGRGNCFDDINQLSLMSKSMAASTFHKFCARFAEEMFEEHIYLPTGTYQDEVMDNYRKLGFTGAIGSTDVTHVGWGMCPFTLGRSFTGKEGFPTLAFEVTVDHAGRAIGVTQGFTGTTNDKTIIRYDAAVQNIRTDSRYRDREYKLRQKDGGEFTRKGCYLIVDNGYHEVRSTSRVVTVPSSTCSVPVHDNPFGAHRVGDTFFYILVAVHASFPLYTHHLHRNRHKLTQHTHSSSGMHSEALSGLVPIRQIFWLNCPPACNEVDPFVYPFVSGFYGICLVS